MARKSDQKSMALLSFCSAMEAASGVSKTGAKAWVPQIAALEGGLGVLGEAYLDACLALDRLPKLVKERPYAG